MALARATYSIMLCIISACTIEVRNVEAQEAPIPQLTPGSERSSERGSERKPAPPSRGQSQNEAKDQTSQPAPAQTVALTIAKGSPLQIALDDEVQVKKVGQPVNGRIVEPVYAFDHIVVPVGSKVTGKVTKIEALSSGKRTLAALNADFTPVRKVEVGFDELVLADGRHFTLHTSVTPGSGQIIQLVTAANAKEKKNTIKDMASEKTNQAKQQAHQQWDNAMKQVKEPGKVHRLERYGEAQSPIHR